MTHLLIAHRCVRLKEGSMFILESNTPESKILELDCLD